MVSNKNGRIIPNTTGAYAWRVFLNGYGDDAPFAKGLKESDAKVSKFDEWVSKGYIYAQYEPIIGWRVRLDNGTQGHITGGEVEAVFANGYYMINRVCDYIVEPNTDTYQTHEGIGCKGMVEAKENFVYQIISGAN